MLHAIGIRGVAHNYFLLRLLCGEIRGQHKHKSLRVSGGFTTLLPLEHPMLRAAHLHPGE